MARNLVDNDFNKVNGQLNQSAISQSNLISSNTFSTKRLANKSNCRNFCADTPPPPYRQTSSNEDFSFEFNATHSQANFDENSKSFKSVPSVVNSSSIDYVKCCPSDMLTMPAQSVKNDRSSLRLQLNENNCSSKPKLIIQPESFGGSDDSDDDEDKPALHVQFHNESSNPSSCNGVKEPCPPTPDSISSSSSSSSSSESIDISEVKPPDGGWGWVIVAVSFIVNLIADGITFSFGIIYHEFLNYFGEDKSKTAWIGSLFMAMPLLSGPIASFLTDRYGCRKVTIVGSILAASGFLLSSQANSTEILYITFGGLAGFGLSLCYVASVVIVAYYFDKKRSFATGLAVCGSGIGTFIFAPLIQVLLHEYGWRGTTIILAGLFLNLAVCGALMRDLPWTAYKNKSAAKERKHQRNLKRKKNYSSADTFSVSNSSNTASVLQPIAEVQEPDDSDDAKDEEQSRLYSSLVNLPTYVRNGEKVPAEVLELLSAHKNVYNVLLQNYPNLLTPSRSFSDSGRLHKAHLATKAPLPQSPLATEAFPVPSPTTPKTDTVYLLWSKKNEMASSKNNPQKKLQTAYLKDLKIHRLSLTYRGAMLNINRYRLRASSCPDIYRNSMTTIAKEKMEWYAGLWDFWDLIVDIIDFSHFSNAKYLLFALSNFLLYTWYDVEYMYLSDHAIGMGFSDKDASILISVVGIVNMFGEIILGWAGDRPWINVGIIYAICMCCCGAVTGLVPLLKSYWALCIVSGGFGFFIAANYSLTCIILVELITLERFTNAYGLLLLVQGIANLVGPPLAGLISDITGTYDLSFYIAGVFIAISGLLLMILPASKRYKKFQRQASNDDSIKDTLSEGKCCSFVLCTNNRSEHYSPKENHV